MKVQSDILLHMDGQIITQLVLIDLSAAFDTVDHAALLNIMSNYFGVAGNVINWIHSYLQLRSQCVIIDGIKSKRLDLKQGVPERSCFGPIFFTDYTSHIFNVIHAHRKTACVC